MTPDEAHAALDALLEHNAALERECGVLRSALSEIARNRWGREACIRVAREALEQGSDDA